MPSRDVDVLILGAGIAGLAGRFRLSGRREAVCVDAAPEVGGLLRMFPHDGFSFDSTVHALPARDAIAGTLLADLLGEDVHTFRRQNLVWQHGRTVGYPYQFNAHGLPPEVRDECLAGFPEGPRGAVGSGWVSFEDWLLDQFGPGFYRHFFEPYNRKLYGVAPGLLEAAPMTWTIPAEGRAAVVRGASGPPADAAGPECTYPKGKAGIATLAVRLAELGRGEILLGQRVTSVDLDARKVFTAEGLEIGYQALVSTLALPILLGCARGLPPEMSRWAGLLAAAPVTVVRIAIERSGEGLPAQWTYFPDRQIPFYRLTRLERISSDLAPEGACACLLEFPGTTAPSDGELIELCRRLGVAGPGAVECAGRLVIPHAYVLFQRGHREACASITDHLAGRGVQVAGRYGRWGYANIGQTIETGLRAADELLAVSRGVH